MSDLSSSREQQVLENIRSGGVYVSLHSADEGNEPDGSNEVSAADYSRTHLAASNMTISGSAPTQITNDVDVTWDTTQNDWGTVAYAALWSTAQGDTGEEPYTVTMQIDNGGDAPSGVDVSIPAGSLTFEID